MAYETHYTRYDVLRATYKIKVGTFDILSREQRANMTHDEQREFINKAIEEYDVVIERAGYGYAHEKYRVLRNTPNLSTQDLAIICDRGNLCFGYRVERGCICVYTD